MGAPFTNKEWDAEADNVFDRSFSDLKKANPGKKVTHFDVWANLWVKYPMRHPLKWRCELRAMQEMWPGYLYLQKDGINNTWFMRIIKALNYHKFVNLMGCSSAGKTFGASAHCYFAWKVRPMNTSVFLSTTSGDAAEMRVWGTVKDLFDRDVFGKRAKWGVQLDYRKCIVLQGDQNDKSDRDYRDSISVVLIRHGSEGKNAIGQICGRKNTHVYWLCDEAAFMDHGIRQARGGLYSNHFVQYIGSSNEPYEGDPQYLDSEPYGEGFEQGWDTPGLDELEQWPTQRGVCVYFDGEKSPNLLAPEDKPAPFPALATREFIARNIEEDGIPDGPNYWRWVKGFPKRGIKQDTVLNIPLLQQYKANEQPLWLNTEYKVVAGLDLGFRADGDPCVADFAKMGRNAEDAQPLMAFEKDGVRLTPKMGDLGSYEQKIARIFLDECAKRMCHHVAADISGDGGLMVQAIEKEANSRGYTLTVFAISFSHAPDENVFYPVAGQMRRATEVCDRKVSQLWMGFRFLIQDRLVRGCDPRSKAVSELCARKVTQDEKKRWSVEKKKDMKKRIKKSPDFGDARVLCGECARRLGLQKTRAKSDKPRLTSPSEPSKVPARYTSAHSGKAYSRR